MPQLHHSTLQRAGGYPKTATLVLHGILGSGPNLRSVAQRLLDGSTGDVAFILVDLRLHGRSQGFSAPHDLEACVADLHALEASLAWPVGGVIGHSFGGKVALAYAASRPELGSLAMLDSAPSARPDRRGSEDTMAVLDMLEQLPGSFVKREDFITHVIAKGHTRALAEWLSMNLDRTPEGFRFRLDVPAIRMLLEDYFRRDLWPVLESFEGRCDLVIGGRSRVFSEDDMTRAKALSANHPNVRVHVLEDAGHWVHVDALDALVKALL